MRLLLIRHGIAVEREAFAASGNDDDLRPLTSKGRRRMRQASKGLGKLVPDLAILASSPLRRAEETSQIIARRYDGLEPVRITQLMPGKPANAVLTWARSQDMAGTIGLVGHEPHLSQFAGWLLTGLQESFLELRKGGACLIELSGELKPGKGRLLWALKPGQIRDLGK